MSELNIVSLNVRRKLDESTVGPKAASLSRMMRIGLPVPPAFCITQAAFRQHIKANNLTARIQSTLDKLTKAKPQAAASLLSELRQAIINAPMADALRDDIANHYRALAADRLAVRSSATAEDLPGHSFAGQYDTCLGVADLPACIDAVKKCWASLWTDRAYTYRQKNGFDHLKVNMAVIVQSLVPADAAGVIFTADPVTGYSSRIVIEACFGLGDSLVSGKVSPDRFRIARHKLRIISKNISEKKSKSVLAPRAGVHEQPVPAHLAAQPCIDDTLITKLAKLAKKAEKKFGCPQDIEWAVSDKNLFFLQSRPVTSKPPQKSWQDRQVWTNANTGEVAPDVVTPITWSVMQMMFNPLFDSTVRLFSLELGDNPLAGLAAGRIYFNLNTCVGALKNFPGLMNPNINKGFGGEHGKMYEIGQIDIPDEDVPDLKFSLAGMILRLPHSIYDILSHTQKKGESFLADMRSKNDQLQNLNISTMSEHELTSYLTTALENALKTWDLLYVLTGLFAFPILYKSCSKWLADSDGTIANKLLAGVGDMDSAQAGLDLWHLATKAHNLPELQKAVTSHDSWQATRKKIITLDTGDEFLQKWGEFMARHGHHCRGELELSNPRWCETPDYILSMVRNYIACIDRTDPLENYKKHARQRQQLAKQCRQKLRNPIKRALFNYLLRKAQKGAILRENWKSQAARYMTILRKMLLELGKKLNERQILQSPDDIFFLEIQELQPVAQNTADFNVKQTIASRRREYQKWQSITPPKVIVGRYDPQRYVPEKVDTETKVLTGLAVSPGAVTGKARVILRSDDQQHVLPGEILVAPFTDPGWTPYFVTAAGVVMDQGGILSHGSIIAREFGIPAVVNVGHATKIIKTGQNIHLDANKGVVTISP